jgi:replicative DNA helicase
MNKVISSVRIGEYCQIVKERSRLRSLLKSLGDVQTKAKNGEFRSTKELLDFTESVVMKLSLERTAGIFQMPELVKAAIVTLEERYKRGDQIIGVPWSGSLELP